MDQPDLKDHLRAISELQAYAERLLEILKAGATATTAPDAFHAIVEARDESDALSGGANRFLRVVVDAQAEHNRRSRSTP